MPISPRLKPVFLFSQDMLLLRTTMKVYLNVSVAIAQQSQGFWDGRLGKTLYTSCNIIISRQNLIISLLRTGIQVYIRHAIAWRRARSMH